ncbi:Chaperonin subunit [Bradyrhizobium erythrophlei]|uniref:Chaperonin subunit n=1 Tax=Bradyrhizobium erythrophlei TaxID=1437360 RepID=A0A1H4YI01_9BRAD|nr:Chaperonin subunit [Bradyrhizobium erythrophlei]
MAINDRERERSYFNQHQPSWKSLPCMVGGEVLIVGPGSRDEMGRIIPLDVKVGDRVLFGKWAGTDVLIEIRHTGVIEGKTRAKAKAA